MRLGMGFAVSLGLIAALGVAGCSDEPGRSEAKDRADAEAVAQVIAQQTPPPVELALQPINYQDISRNSAMEGAGCSFTPGGEEDPFAILGDSMGFVKFEGSIQRLAADAGSKEGPFGTRVKYDGRDYSLRVSIDEAAKEDGEGDNNWVAPASLSMVDGYNREVANSEGRVACGG